jgi:hypothetical protein
MPPAPSPRTDGAAGRSTDSARHPTPRLSASPSLGVDGSPWLLREGGSQSIPLPADPMLSTVAPSWASAVRDGTCSGNPPAASQKDDFFRLYERCVASGLRARVEIRNCSGFQEMTLSCRLQATPHAIGAPRARHCRGSEYPLPEHPPASPPMPTAKIADCTTQTSGTRATSARAPAARALARFLLEPLAIATASQTD